MSGINTKEDLYAAIAAKANAVVDRGLSKRQRAIRKLFGLQFGREVVVDVLTELLRLPMRPTSDGQLVPTSTILPAGLGSFKLVVAKETVRRTPQGKVVACPRRWRFRYNRGCKIDQFLRELPSPR